MNIETEFFQDLDAALARLKDFKLDEMLNEPECEDAVRQASNLEALQAFVPWLKFAPTKFGQYLLYEKIGEGGMGAVYRAQHIHLQKWVALKVLTSRRENNLGAHSQFWREMASLGKLNHPNLVTAHDAGNYDGVQFLVMELVEGVNLNQFVAHHGPLKLAEAAAITRQVSHALEYLESCQLLHRDIKPSNLMMTSSGTVKLLDLGVAQNIEKDRIVTSGESSMAGTLAFMAPELIWQDSEADVRSEIFSLGCTLLFLMTEKKPQRQRSRANTSDKRPASKSLPIDGDVIIPEELPFTTRDLLKRLLASNPGERLQSLSQVGELLDKFTQGAELSKLGIEIDYLMEMNAKQAEDKEISLVLPSRSSSLPPVETQSSLAPISKTRTVFLFLGMLLAGAVVVALMIGDRPRTPGQQEAESLPLTADSLSEVGDPLSSDLAIMKELLANRVSSSSFIISARDLDTGELFQLSSDRIPNDRRFEVEGLGELASFAHFSADDVGLLSQFESLKALFVATLQLDTKFLEGITQCPQVSRIAVEFQNVNIQPADLSLFKKMPALRNLFLLVKTDSPWNITHPLLATLGTHSHFSSLTIRGNVIFDKRSATSWKEYWELIDLHLDGNGLTESAIQEIAQLPQLRVLEITANDLPGDRLLPLQDSSLEQLQLRGIRELSDDQLARILRSQSNLKELSIIDSQNLTGDFLHSLSTKTTLNYLHLVGISSFDSETLSACEEIPNLSRLDLSRTPLDGRSLKHFSEMSQLRLLNLSGTGYSPHLLNELRTALPATIIYPQVLPSP